MPKKFRVTDELFIEILDSDKTQIYIVFEDSLGLRSGVGIASKDVKALVAALTEAAVWLADQVGK